jgi:hypothetical protein
MTARGLSWKLAVASSLSILSSAAQAYTPQQQQLCSNDAMRLCSSDVPDVDRITACMARPARRLESRLQGIFPCRQIRRTEKE